MDKKKVYSNAEFVNRLKFLIKQGGLTQRRVAEMAGTSPSAVGKWLKGTIPGAMELYKLARANGILVEWFLDVIPYKKMPTILADKKKVIEVSVEAIPPSLRPTIADSFYIAYNPEAAKAFIEAVASLENSSEKVLTEAESCAKLETQDMGNTLPLLLERLKNATKETGKMSELAEYLKLNSGNNVPLASVSRWLSGKREPGGSITLLMLRWVEQQERKQ